ncbi:MAG: AraC family transcriptional regulator [Rhodococcus sp. (in: high G+C Gram-positive bacteria)]
MTASHAARADVDTRTLPRYAAGEIDVPFVIGGVYEVMTRDTHWEEHSHPTHELLWNERGVSTATVGSRTWTITSSTGLWIPAGMPHTGWMPAGTWSRAAQFRVDDAPLIADGPVAVDVSPMLRLLLDRLKVDGLSPSSRATTEAMVLDVLSPAAHELAVRIPDSLRLAPIVAAILADPADTTTLEAWSKRLRLSARTITRLFQDETGVGFARWVATARVQRAIALMAHGESIDDVALAVGFRSASAFGTAFRRITGTTPGRFKAL